MDTLLNMETVLVIIGIALMIVEIVVFGFGSLFLLFISLACFGTALLMFLHILPETALVAFMAVAAQSIGWAIVLWKPLRKLQNKQQDPEQQRSALDGLVFTLDRDIDTNHHGSHRYSGIVWEVRAADPEQCPMAAGTEVRVVKSSVGKLFVEKVAAA